MWAVRLARARGAETGQAADARQANSTDWQRHSASSGRAHAKTSHAKRLAQIRWQATSSQATQTWPVVQGAHIPSSSMAFWSVSSSAMTRFSLPTLRLAIVLI